MQNNGLGRLVRNALVLAVFAALSIGVAHAEVTGGAAAKQGGNAYNWMLGGGG